MYKIIGCFLLVLSWSTACWATTIDGHEDQSIISISPTFEMATIGRRMSMFKEENDRYTLEQINSLPASAYREWKNVNIIFGHIRKPFWLKFQLINSDTIDRNLIFEIVDPHLFEMHFHRELESGKFRSDTLFNTDNFFKRAQFQENNGQLHRNLQFHFTLAARDTSDCFLYFPASKFSHNVRMHLWDEDYRMGQQQYSENYILLAFFLLCIIYLLLLGVAISITKFNYFWYYFLYVFLGAFIVFCDLGLGYRYLWPRWSYAQQISIFLILNLYLIFGTLFVRRYFNTRNVFKKIDQALLVIMVIAGGVIPFTFLMPVIDNILYSHILSTSVNILYIATCVLFFCLFFMSYFSSQKIFPGIFLFGFSLHGLSIIIGNLQDVGLVKAGSVSGYLMSIGHPLTIHLQIAFMVGMLLEMSVIFYLAIKRFARLYKQNNISLQNLATQKQKTMNAMVVGIEKERERWSHELHDGLGVRLSLLKQELQMLSSHFTQPVKAEDKLGLIIDELDTAHQDLRNISHNIMPKSLHKLGLRSAIEELLYRLRLVDNALEVNFFPHADLEGIPRFSQQQLYHIVQELLNNMIKHSQATEINLQFVQHQDQMILTMEDNGQGFDVNRAYRNGIGLKNIKNRVSVLAGKFLVDSAPGRGTLISVEIPLDSLLEKDLTRVDDPTDT